MEENELKDILLDRDDENKSAKLKKLLMFVAALVVLFLVIVITMKLINSDDTPQNQAEIDSRLVLPPMPQQAQTQDIISNEKKNDDQLFEQVPIEPADKSKDDFEDMIKKLKDKENNKTKVKDSMIVSKPESKDEPKTEIKEQSKAEPKEQPRAIDKKEQSKPAMQKSTPKVETPKVVTNVRSNVSVGAYVQVFATGKFNPNASYIKQLGAKGYSYKTLKVGEITKILVGPLSGNNLSSTLSDIRKDVNKDAFIYRHK
ncbi:hypothetical protein KDD93_00835 [Campylobacter sp. faydin G-24]|uniref:SPOR domain-containing protein n=1 Tax=Campylobacter anatolicus TaxID=2829105 RepID=A0ABS5HFR9_9BACT|nr:hypothetical protein [Campylobacter anatolicus]MBR8462432.1 hypothetical protein [Campylobacter anatolicus]MBR8463119.1 hypothetical protein [Campylobacter anatolicus]